MFKFDEEYLKFLTVIGEIVVESIRVELEEIGLTKNDSRIWNRVNYEVSVKQGLIVTIPDYYKYIESGRRPFARRVPIQALIEWMKRKKIALNDLNNVAYKIQHSIYLRGIKGRPFLFKAFNEAEKIVDAQIGVQLDDLFRDVFNFYFKNFGK